MNKTLLILATHFIDETVISEYKKMRNTPNVDAILAIDNNAYKYDFTQRIENKVFYGVSVKCFFVDSNLHDEMDLPYYFSYNNIKDFAKVMWHNCDYRFYYVRKFFPNYDYYWNFEYDVFCNGNDYSLLINNTIKNTSDLLIKHLSSEKKAGKWNWSYDIDWIYKTEQLYRAFFPVVRLSAKAVDFLYKRRLTHKEIFESYDGKKQWVHCEFFVTTELINSGFFCNDLYEEPYIGHIKIYLNDDRIFLKPNGHLYHPVKSAKKEVEDLKNQVDNLSFLLRKIFLTALIKSLDALNVKGLPYHINQDFNYLIVPVVTGGGQPPLYYVAQIFGNSIYVGLHCEENFSKINIAEFAGVQSLQGFSATNDGRRLAIFIMIQNKIDDSAAVATAMKNLIVGTYPILKKNLS